MTCPGRSASKMIRRGLRALGITFLGPPTGFHTAFRVMITLSIFTQSTASNSQNPFFRTLLVVNWNKVESLLWRSRGSSILAFSYSLVLVSFYCLSNEPLNPDFFNSPLNSAMTELRFRTSHYG